jgi:hypothetical protein
MLLGPPTSGLHEQIANKQGRPAVDRAGSVPPDTETKSTSKGADTAGSILSGRGGVAMDCGDVRDQQPG